MGADPTPAGQAPGPPWRTFAEVKDRLVTLAGEHLDVLPAHALGDARPERLRAGLLGGETPRVEQADLARATAFYEAVGAKKNEQFCDGTASCMIFSDTIHAMLLTHDKFRQFTPKKIADARETSEVLIPTARGNDPQRGIFSGGDL
jgi:hypothetical protein